MDLKGSDVEILKHLEERTKLNKDALFRKKKELQRLTTDMEEDSRRLEQVEVQNDKMLKQKEHLMNAKRQVTEELSTQESQQTELQEKMMKVLNKHRKKVVERGVDPSTIMNGTLEEKSVKAEVTFSATPDTTITITNRHYYTNMKTKILILSILGDERRDPERSVYPWPVGY